MHAQLVKRADVQTFDGRGFLGSQIVAADECGAIGAVALPPLGISVHVEDELLQLIQAHVSPTSDAATVKRFQTQTEYCPCDRREKGARSWGRRAPAGGKSLPPEPVYPPCRSPAAWARRVDREFP